MTKKNQKQFTEEEEIYEKLSVLFIYMEQGLEIRDSNLYENRVTICRGKDLVKFMSDNVEEVAKHVLNICKVDIGPKSKNYMQNFYDVYNNLLNKVPQVQDTN